MTDKKLVIAMLTFKRPGMLVEALRSLRQLELPNHWRVTLVIIDNDKNRSAENTVKDNMADFPFPIRYVVEEQQGIPFARNRALQEALSGDALLFIDDDEIADWQWLIQMVAAFETYKADAVQGKVCYKFPNDVTESIRNASYYQTPQRETGISLRIAYTNNVLIGATLYRDLGLRFHPAFAASGGEDHHFFHEAIRKGTKIIWCNEGIITATVPQSRLNQLWLIRQAFRAASSGTLSDILLLGYPKAFVKNMGYGSMRFGLGVLLLPVYAASPGKDWHQALRHMVIGAGRMGGLFGLSYGEYKNVHGY